ncbi:MAG: M15 family metallopeptidase [Acidimicrobiia bacterium]|nr:M15 family metallopeptidase [Acidimicrobiia bacterium]
MGALVLGACGSDTGSLEAAPPAPADTTPTSTTATTTPEATVPAAVAASSASPPPAWLGRRPLPLGPDGYGEIQPTPPELRDRRLTTTDVLAPPADATFTSAVVPVPEPVVARSTWSPECPVSLDDLRYVTVAHWGFDDLAHTGELLVNADVATDVVEVFERLYEAQFPIEEMRITRVEELDLHPTGDGNNTGSFVCRPSRGTTSWSEHAYGRSVDINPFHNPYVKGDVVLPELASAYKDRAVERPGMILAGDVVTEAFAAIGWGWGGTWRSSTDTMHFSATGR